MDLCKKLLYKTAHHPAAPPSIDPVIMYIKPMCRIGLLYRKRKEEEEEVEEFIFHKKSNLTYQ